MACLVGCLRLALLFNVFGICLAVLFWGLIVVLLLCCGLCYLFKRCVIGWLFFFVLCVVVLGCPARSCFVVVCPVFVSPSVYYYWICV